MSTAELKSNLHKFIANTDDIDILQRVLEVFKAFRQDTSVEEDLSPYEKKMVAHGLKDLEQGKFISNDELKDQFKNWINEKRQ